MTNKVSTRLKNSYKKYRQVKPSKKKVMDFFRAFMPEIVFRTTKLEGEPVSRKMTKSIFN